MILLHSFQSSNVLHLSSLMDIMAHFGSAYDFTLYTISHSLISFGWRNLPFCYFFPLPFFYSPRKCNTNIWTWLVLSYYYEELYNTFYFHIWLFGRPISRKERLMWKLINRFTVFNDFTLLLRTRSCILKYEKSLCDGKFFGFSFSSQVCCSQVYSVCFFNLIACFLVTC